MEVNYAAKPGTSRPHTRGDRIAVVVNHMRAKHQTDCGMLLGGGQQTLDFTQIVLRAIAKPSGESEATALIDHQGFLGQHKSRTVLLHFDFAPTVCRKQTGPLAGYMQREPLTGVQKHVRVRTRANGSCVSRQHSRRCGDGRRGFGLS